MKLNLLFLFAFLSFLPCWGKNCRSPILKAGAFSGLSFQPTLVLKEHGLDPAAVLIRKLDPFTFRLEYQGSEVGHIHLKRDGEKHAIVENVEIQDAFLGKGLGTLLYIAASKSVFDTEHRILKMSDNTNENSRKIWENLEDHGFAQTQMDRDSGEMHPMMRDSKLRSPEMSSFLHFIR